MEVSRWNLALDLINNWWVPLLPEDGSSEEDLRAAEERLGITLPLALREWYLLAGKRRDFIGNEDDILSPERFFISSDHLVFCGENQWVVQWGISFADLDQADPPVKVDLDPVDESEEEDPTSTEDEDSHGWEPQYETFSDFITAMIASATVTAGQFNGFVPTSAALSQAVAANYPLIQELQLLEDSISSLYGDENTIIAVGEYNFDFSARSKKAAQLFLERTAFDAAQVHHHGLTWMHTYSDGCQDVQPPFNIRRESPGGDNYQLAAGRFPRCHIGSGGMSAYPHNYDYENNEDQADE